jgi:hypothetical protein
MKKLFNQFCLLDGLNSWSAETVLEHSLVTVTVLRESRGAWLSTYRCELKYRGKWGRGGADFPRRHLHDAPVRHTRSPSRWGEQEHEYTGREW